ncbi:MAG TPA: FTR1 family protein [Rhizomicrobium sp.]|nr:FTR1 family protein [Rhizomicrobium sp.]
MLATLLIVFREVIEAGLIVGIVLAATQGVPRRGLWVGYGIVGGVVGACVVAAFAGEIASLFAGAGQDFFYAAILLVAVGMLTWHNVWMAGHGREMAREMKTVGAAVTRGERPLTALAIVVGIAVLREGSEVVLFLYGIASAGGTSQSAMLLGGILGVAAGVGLTALMYYGLVAIPASKLFSVTSWLITLVAAGLAAQAVLYIQQEGYLEFWSAPLWDTSWLLPQGGTDWRGLIGQMLHTLVGYNDSPNGPQLLVYAATVATMVCLMRWERSRHPRGALTPAERAA